MEPLKIGITGVRGVVGQTLTPELVVRFAEAFGAYLDGGRVLVCRDPRPSGPMLQAAVTAGPALGRLRGGRPRRLPDAVAAARGRRDRAPRAASRSPAGHNPGDWNALKFVRGDGLYLNAIQGEELLDVYHQGAVSRVGWDRMATRVAQHDAIDAAPRAAAAALRRGARARAAGCAWRSTAATAPARVLVPRWLDGARLRGAADQRRPVAALPAPARALDRGGRPGARGGAGRQGRPRPGARRRRRAAEPRRRGRPAALRGADAAARGRGDARPAPRARWSRTSRRARSSTASPRATGSRVVRTPVGQAFISEAIVEHAAVLGGEGNGAVAVPEVQATHDSAATIGLLLEHLARTRRAASRRWWPSCRCSPCASWRVAVAPSAALLGAAGLPRPRRRGRGRERRPDGRREGARGRTAGCTCAPRTRSRCCASSPRRRPRQRAQELADWARERVRL